MASVMVNSLRSSEVIRNSRLGWVNQKKFVDPNNGNDNNDGATKPVKTIDEALRRCLPFTNTWIYLYSGSTYTISDVYYIRDCGIMFVRETVEGVNAPNPLIMNTLREDSNRTTGLKVTNVYFSAANVKFKTASYTTDDTAADLWEGILQRHDTGNYIANFYDCEIEIMDTPFTRIQSGPGGPYSLSLFSTKVIRHNDTKRTAPLVLIENGHPYEFYTSNIKLITDQDGNTLKVSDIISGIVRDSNGALVNLVTNTVV
jgi:hypothetical protein